MGWDENGVWLGYCPSFPPDEHRCCLSLNIIPVVVGLLFIFLSIGCATGWAWGVLYLIVGPILFAFTTWIATTDQEWCLVSQRPALPRGCPAV